MYTGHVAIALGVRGARRDLPLWILVAASQACDWVEVLIDAAGGRAHAELWSHAFPFVMVPAAIFAIAVGAWKRSLGAAAVLLAVYLSHPAADLVTGYKPLWLGGPDVGLHYINRPIADFVTQATVCVLGYALYRRSLPAVRARRLLTLAPLAVLLALQALSDFIVYVRRRAPAPTSLSVPNATPVLAGRAGWARASS
jgi:hypothetical protein